MLAPKSHIRVRVASVEGLEPSCVEIGQLVRPVGEGKKKDVSSFTILHTSRRPTYYMCGSTPIGRKSNKLGTFAGIGDVINCANFHFDRTNAWY
jgi:hypothetical protein